MAWQNRRSVDSWISGLGNWRFWGLDALGPGTLLFANPLQIFQDKREKYSDEKAQGARNAHVQYRLGLRLALSRYRLVQYQKPR